MKVLYTLTQSLAVPRENNTQSHGGADGRESFLGPHPPWGLCGALGSQIQSLGVEVHGVALRKCRKDFIFPEAFPERVPVSALLIYRWSRIIKGNQSLKFFQRHSKKWKAHYTLCFLIS